MESLTYAVRMWQLEGTIAVSLLAVVYALFQLKKVWRAPDGLSLIFFLGIGLVLVTLLFISFRDRIHWFTNNYALYFILLYCWCALGTVFVAYRQTHLFKLVVGLLSQAGIVYGLYLII